MPRTTCPMASRLRTSEAPTLPSPMTTYCLLTGSSYRNIFFGIGVSARAMPGSQGQYEGDRPHPSQEHDADYQELPERAESWRNVQRKPDGAEGTGHLEERRKQREPIGDHEREGGYEDEQCGEGEHREGLLYQPAGEPPVEDADLLRPPRLGQQDEREQGYRRDPDAPARRRRGSSYKHERGLYEERRLAHLGVRNGLEPGGPWRH